MDIDRDDLDWAAEEGIVSAEQAGRLWGALQDRAEPRSVWHDPSTLAYYAGALVVIVAMGWFAVRVADAFGPLVLAGTAAGYGIAFAGAGAYLRREVDLGVAGGLLVVVAVTMVPVVVYGLERGMGLWTVVVQGAEGLALLPAPSIRGWTQADLVAHLQESWVPEEGATVVAAAAALRYVRFPFLTAPAAFALWHMAVVSGPELFGTPWSENTELWGTVVLGAATIGGAYAIDRRARADYAFWGYLFGLAAFWGGLTAMDGGSEWAYFGYFLVNAVLVLGAVILRQWPFLGFGALGTLLYLAHLAGEVFAGSILYPLALSGLGVGLIYAGIMYQRNRAAIDRWLRAALPPVLRNLAPPRE